MPDCKPNSVCPERPAAVAVRIGETIIYLGQLSPAASSGLPALGQRRMALLRLAPDVALFGLAPHGVCLAAPVTRNAGEHLPHHFTHHLCRTYPAIGWSVFCCTCRHCSMSSAFPLGSMVSVGVRTFLIASRRKRRDDPSGVLLYKGKDLAFTPYHL